MIYVRGCVRLIAHVPNFLILKKSSKSFKLLTFLSSIFIFTLPCKLHIEVSIQQFLCSAQCTLRNCRCSAVHQQPSCQITKLPFPKKALKSKQKEQNKFQNGSCRKSGKNHLLKLMTTIQIYPKGCLNRFMTRSFSVNFKICDIRSFKVIVTKNRQIEMRSILLSQNVNKL